jgi:N-acetylmuramoyl-L-alanine amidase
MENGRMRTAVLLLILAGSLCAQAQSALTSLQKTRLEGKDYVRLKEWAFVTKLDLRWLIKDRQLLTTNASSRVLFEINSRRAQINGINFLLSDAIISRDDKVYVSLLDLKATLHPVLFPDRNPTNMLIQTICLDAGHGGKDPGKLDGRNEEKKYALLLAEEVERILKQSGFKIVQTRRRDTFVDLLERSKVASEQGADLFVSLHYNAADNRSAQGAEVYCLTPVGAISSNAGSGSSAAPAYSGSAQNAKNVLLGYHVQKSLVRSLSVEDRGVKRAQFVVLSSAKVPAVLIEAGFMTNPTEANRIYDPAYRKKMALAIVDGILAYKKVVER